MYARKALRLGAYAGAAVAAVFVPLLVNTLTMLMLLAQVSDAAGATR